MQGPKIVRIVLLAAAVLGWAQAQALPAPVDPLRRPEVQPGEFNLAVHLGYRPDGFAQLGLDRARGPYTDTVAVYGLAADLALAYAWSPTLSLGVGLTYGLTHHQILRTYADASEERIQKTEQELAPRLALSGRLAPDDPLDPTLAVTFAYPWAVSASVSGSYLRDPVVLSLALGAAHRFVEPRTTTLELALGMGFVANEQVSYRVTASLVHPLAFAQAPTLSATLGVILTLDPEARRSLVFSLEGRTVGGRLGWGLYTGWEARF